MHKIFGANWTTTVSGITGIVMAFITWLSTLSYDQGPIAMIIPIQYKPYVTKIAAVAALILLGWNAIQQKSRNVTGGTTMQDAAGDRVPNSRATLVQQTIAATPLESR